MKNKTLDLYSFTYNQLLAKLTIISMNFERKKPELIDLGKNLFLLDVEKIVKQNFIYPSGKLQNITNHLALFLLGNKDNLFDKTLNQNS
jgi:hypothetical protein